MQVLFSQIRSQMENMDKQFTESVQSLSTNNYEKLDQIHINEGFSFLKMTFMAPPPSIYGPRPPPMPPSYDAMYSQSSNPHFQPGHSQSHRSSYEEEYGLNY